MVGKTPHWTNEFAVPVADSAIGRKGTGGDIVRDYYTRCEEQSPRNDPWMDRVIDGLSTGEGVMEALVDKEELTDKRLMVFEGEFGRILTAMSRPDNILSHILRNAWDSGTLNKKTRKDPIHIKGAHLSVVGHITKDELMQRLSDTDKANGVGNRFLWVAVRRWKLIPRPPTSFDDGDLVRRMVEAQTFAHTVGLMRRSGEYNRLWDAEYKNLSCERHGLSGALCNRAEAHVLRLSMIYALLDCSTIIKEVHLRAALEVWRYCEDSVKYIFGNALGDYAADTIYRAMCEKVSMTRTEIWDLFSRNPKVKDFDRPLDLLERTGRIRRVIHKTGKPGRPEEKWEVLT
jgi:Protein of unknown function (DUF3987)